MSYYHTVVLEYLGDFSSVRYGGQESPSEGTRMPCTETRRQKTGRIPGCGGECGPAAEGQEGAPHPRVRLQLRPDRVCAEAPLPRCVSLGRGCRRTDGELRSHARVRSRGGHQFPAVHRRGHDFPGRPLRHDRVVHRPARGAECAEHADHEGGVANAPRRRHLQPVDSYTASPPPTQAYGISIDGGITAGTTSPGPWSTWTTIWPGISKA